MRYAKKEIKGRINDGVYQATKVTWLVDFERTFSRLLEIRLHFS
jgi:hypothetical protein